MQSTKYLDCVEEYITDAGLDNSSTKKFPAGTILYTIFATLGEVCILNIDAATNQAIAGIQIESNQIETDYLYYYLLSQKTVVNNIGRGVAQNNINLKILRDFEVPIPPLDEQRKIAAGLDKVSDLIAKRYQQLDKLDLLVKSKFAEMFGDLKKNNKGWPICCFEEFAKIDTKMIHSFEGYEDYPHIGIDSIEKNTGNLLEYRTVGEDGVMSGKYLFTPEHIIYSKIRPNLNKVALPEFVGVCSADAYPILPKKERCNRVFLAYAMRSPVFLDYILAFSDRTNLPKVNKKQVEGFKCPIPNVALQQEFAAFVEQTVKSKATIQRSLAKLETLKKALMQQYFE